MAALPPRVLFGAAHYHEYQPHDRLKADLDLMAEARFTVIRVDESVWSPREPDNGRFDLDWLLPVLDGAHERGIPVVLGTPAYAVPPWLSRQYPEVAAGHPAVIGFRVDDEPGLRLLHDHGLFQRFADRLRERYGAVQALNRGWGLVCWSHLLSSWADLWTPDNNAQPRHDVAWRAFQARQTTGFVRWQAGVVRALHRGGVLPHSGWPGRVYAEVARPGAEFDAAGALVAGIEPDSDIAFAYSTPDKRLAQRHPPPATADGGPEAAARRHPVPVAAGLRIADDATPDWPVAYADAGGRLVVGPRTGYADHEARPRPEPAPPRLVDAAGVRYDEFGDVATPLPVHAAADGPLALPPGATATRRVEGLTSVDAEVLAGYDHPHFGRRPAVTTRRRGAGRVTRVGTAPGRALARALAAWPAPSPVGGWSDLPAAVTATTGTSPAGGGRRVHVVHNWSARPAEVVVPHDLTDVLSGDVVGPGGLCRPGAWDVRVFAGGGTGVTP